MIRPCPVGGLALHVLSRIPGSIAAPGTGSTPMQQKTSAHETTTSGRNRLAGDDLAKPI